MTGFRIGRRRIGPDRPVFVIAEVGVNHNGDPDIARRLVEVARRAGADAVKFQTFRAERLATAQAPLAAYQKATVGSGNQLEMLKALELRPEDLAQLKVVAESKGLVFLSTPFDLESVDLLRSLDVAAYKIASGDLTNHPLLEAVAKTHRPLVVSTGMATMAEVRETHALLRRLGTRHMFLHCTSDYPAPVEDLHLRAIGLLRRELGTEVGYSDHSATGTASVAAVALGATVLERHITLDRALPGPDHRASTEPDAFVDYVRAVRETSEALGQETKRPSARERDTARVARKSLVARVDLPKGTRLSLAHLDAKRPGTGIPPNRLAEVLGRRTRRALRVDDLLAWTDLERGHRPRRVR